jgi:hypothetical protein
MKYHELPKCIRKCYREYDVYEVRRGQDSKGNPRYYIKLVSGERDKWVSSRIPPSRKLLWKVIQNYEPGSRHETAS